MRRGFVFFGGVVLALLAEAAGRAQERPNGFYLTSPLGLSSGYDNNFVAGSGVLDDSVSLLTTPTMSWMKSTHQSMFSVDYQAEFEMFANHENLDAWNHAANLHFRRQITARLSFDAADSFLSTDDPTRRLVNSLLLLPRGRYQENDLYARLAYRLDHRTVVSVRFDNAVTTMALPAEFAGRLDRAGFAGTATVHRTVRKRHLLSANYAYLYIHPLQTGSPEINTTAQNVDLGYTFTVNPGLIIRTFGGFTRAAQSAFTGAAAVDKKFGGVWLSAGYQRYLGLLGGLAPIGVPASPIPFTVGLVPNSIYQVATLRAWGKPTNRVGLEGDVQRALNGVTPENQGIKGVIVQLRLDYKLNDRLTVFTQTDFYGQNIDEFSTAPFSRRRYFAGLEVTLSRAPELSDDPHRHRPPGIPSQSEQGESDLREGH